MKRMSGDWRSGGAERGRLSGKIKQGFWDRHPPLPRGTPVRDERRKRGEGERRAGGPRKTGTNRHAGQEVLHLITGRGVFENLNSVSTTVNRTNE